MRLDSRFNPVQVRAFMLKEMGDNKLGAEDGNSKNAIANLPIPTSQTTNSEISMSSRDFVNAQLVLNNEFNLSNGVNENDIKIKKFEQYNEAMLKNMGFTDEYISYYFSVTEGEDGRPSYALRNGVVLNNKDIKSVEELKEVMDLGERQCGSSRYILESLKEIGFSDEQINMYSSLEKGVLGGKDTYLLNLGLTACLGGGTMRIRTFEQLFDAIKSGAVITTDIEEEIRHLTYDELMRMKR